jgi:hypothetical protein
MSRAEPTAFICVYPRFIVLEHGVNGSRIYQDRLTVANDACMQFGARKGRKAIVGQAFLPVT